ncbi:hypothetical protein GCM10027596_40870 [Nocardioides korecus]
MMTTHTAVRDASGGREQCWCCDAAEVPARIIRLGNHPEVALCLGCARWAAQRAGRIEDEGRKGLGVRVRGVARTARDTVVSRGWHRHRLFGGPLRRLRRWFP